MKYTVLEVLPGKLKVRYSDNSWAYVPVPPNATLEKIDEAVANFDPEFFPSVEDTIPVGLAVGDVRESKKVDDNLPQVELSDPDEIFSGLNVALSRYFSQNGDNRLENYLNERLITLINDRYITADQILENLMYDPEEIVAQAQLELDQLIEDRYKS
jgi:hypothetical protein